MNRTAALLAGVLVVGTVAAPAALAAPKKKPITKTYTASAPMPDPTNWAEAEPVARYSVCAQNVPDSYDIHAFKAPAAGKLSIELSNYSMGPLDDWDLLLMDAAGEEMSASGSGAGGNPEVITIKFKKAQEVQIVACNWSGGPTGQVKYTFTYS